MRKELIVMCRTGVTATVLLGALADLYKEFGYDKLVLYDGSWLEYSTEIVRSSSPKKHESENVESPQKTASSSKL